MYSHCPSCGEIAIRPITRSSDLLLIGEFPGDSELEKGKPFVGPSGGVLRTELAHIGLDMIQFSMTNLWLHKPNKNENCYKVGYDICLEMAKDKKAILLVGSDVVETFTNGYKVSEIAGLPLDLSDHKFSCKNVMAILNPAIVFKPNRGIGELRFGIESFYKMLIDRKVIDE